MIVFVWNAAARTIRIQDLKELVNFFERCIYPKLMQSKLHLALRYAAVEVGIHLSKANISGELIGKLTSLSNADKAVKRKAVSHRMHAPLGKNLALEHDSP